MICSGDSRDGSGIRSLKLARSNSSYNCWIGGEMGGIVPLKLKCGRNDELEREPLDVIQTWRGPCNEQKHHYVLHITYRYNRYAENEVS